MESSTSWLPPVGPPGPPPVGPPSAPPVPVEQYEPNPPKRSRFREKASAAGAALIALIAKLKTALLLLPKLKLLITVGSMLISVAAYALLFGWTFAAGLVVLLFIHEMGHVIALRREGIKASAPM